MAKWLLSVFLRLPGLTLKSGRSVGRTWTVPGRAIAPALPGRIIRQQGQFGHTHRIAPSAFAGALVALAGLASLVPRIIDQRNTA